MRVLNIELRFDDSDPDKVKIITEAGKVAAKHWWTQALLISDKRKPQVALFGSDFFSSEESISLADDIPQDEPDGADDDGTTGNTDAPEEDRETQTTA